MSRSSETDRRVRRTFQHLGDALVGLLHEKPYETIAVKEILARANVGRSTFYAHFSGKDELLASEIRHMLNAGAPRAAEPVGRAERVIAFARPILERIERGRLPTTAEVGQSQHAVHERVERLIAELVEAELKRAGIPAVSRSSALPRELLAHHIAATFVRVLAWWGEHGNVMSASEVEARFASLVRPVLEDALRQS